MKVQQKTTWRINLDGAGEPILLLWVNGVAVEGFALNTTDPAGWETILDTIASYDVRDEWLGLPR